MTQPGLLTPYLSAPPMNEATRRRMAIQAMIARSLGGRPPGNQQMPNALQSMFQSPGMLAPPGQQPQQAGEPTPPEAPGTVARMPGSLTQEVPGLATPEQAAQERARMMRKAGAGLPLLPTVQTGQFLPVYQRSAAGNIFASDPRWHFGLFDLTDYTSPFDAFFVNRANSYTWL